LASTSKKHVTLNNNSKNLNDISQIKGNDYEKVILRTDNNEASLLHNIKKTELAIFYSTKSINKNKDLHCSSNKKLQNQKTIDKTNIIKENFAKDNTVHLPFEKPKRVVLNLYHKEVDKNRKRLNEIYKITPELTQKLKQAKSLKNSQDLETYQKNLVLSYFILDKYNY